MSRAIAVPCEKCEDTSVYRTERKELMFAREWLNLPQHNTIASIVVNASVNKEYKDNKLIEVYLSHNFNISDCSNKIGLEFSVREQKDYENSLYKLDTLIDTIRKFKGAVVKARSIQLEVDDNNKKLKKPRIDG